jgi:putative NIF3 family GTP cyclohydrolase 1 type 2
MQTGEVLAFLREFTPPFLSESWDNTGLLIGSESRDVSRIVTCLTLTPDVAQEAVEREAQLVVTHLRFCSERCSRSLMRIPRGGCCCN